MDKPDGLKMNSLFIVIMDKRNSLEILWEINDVKIIVTKRL